MNLQKIEDQLVGMNYYERQVFVFLLTDYLEQQAQTNRRIAGVVRQKLLAISHTSRP